MKGLGFKRLWNFEGRIFQDCGEEGCMLSILYLNRWQFWVGLGTTVKRWSHFVSSA